MPELAVLFYADRRVRLNLPSPRDRSSQTGESSAIWKLGGTGSEKSVNEATSGYIKGTIRGDLRYLVVSRDVRRHRLISIDYIQRCAVTAEPSPSATTFNIYGLRSKGFPLGGRGVAMTVAVRCNPFQSGT